MQFTDKEIIEANNGKIVPGDYFVFPGRIPVSWKSHNIDKVNILYETILDGRITETQIIQNFKCSATEINNYSIDFSKINVNVNAPYPRYRIKIVDSENGSIIIYSNYFKVSINIVRTEEIIDVQ
jgi:hypothetical protein